MVVYADILILLNFIVDYLLLRLTSRISRQNPKLWRILLGSAVGGISSLYIFLPKSYFIIEFAVRIAIALILGFITFGFGHARRYLRIVLTFLAATYLYAGAMIAFWYIFKPQGMVINNSTVYFNISPVFLVVFTVIAYFLIVMLRKIFTPVADTSRLCKITVYANENELNLDGIVDTGNSLEDIFGISEIIIADEACLRFLFGENLSAEAYPDRFRTIPCQTVSGTELLCGYRCECAKIEIDGKKTRLEKPILAISKTPLKGDFSAIINPKSLS